MAVAAKAIVWAMAEAEVMVAAACLMPFSARLPKFASARAGSKGGASNCQAGMQQSSHLFFFAAGGWTQLRLRGDMAT